MGATTKAFPLLFFSSLSTSLHLSPLLFFIESSFSLLFHPPPLPMFG